MIEFTGKLTRVEQIPFAEQYEITFLTNELPASINDNADKELKIVGKTARKKRSTDANAYCWVLIGKIAKALNTSNMNVYERCVRDYGFLYMNENREPEVIAVLNNINIADFLENHNYAQWIGNSYSDNGEVFSKYIIYRGSSQYNSKEMSHFIDCIVNEAKELGIDVIPRVELEKLKEKWHL